MDIITWVSVIMVSVGVGIMMGILWLVTDGMVDELDKCRDLLNEISDERGPEDG